MAREICFQENDIKLYLFLLLIIILFVIYSYIYNKHEFKKENISNIDFTVGLDNDALKNKIKLLENELYQEKLSSQKCQIDLNNCVQQTDLSSVKSTLYNKIYNPLTPPERIYPGGRIGSRSYDDYQLTGFVYNDNDRYPLYGRPKYPGKTDKYEYYIIDESRNKLKIPFKSKNDNELYSGDKIDIPSVGNNLNINIYEYDSFRYNPDIL